MPALTKSLPKYRKHRASGQAVVTIAGVDHYLGPHRTAASRREYDRLVAEWLTRGRQPAPSADTGPTVVEVVAAYNASPTCGRARSALCGRATFDTTGPNRTRHSTTAASGSSSSAPSRKHPPALPRSGRVVSLLPVLPREVGSWAFLFDAEGPGRRLLTSLGASGGRSDCPRNRPR
ncbi:hypothetical protein Pla108_03950 [Botrimarina colliarenosi]|uniref:Uncharacterized protein n=1 Tax=Botrimarina colliarenosi TaxID=2528001 RepID=A0A5C6AJ89_9BACT|nr:hypothetical protein [Botrimarina colliarenosi]TWT99456.1 hypothetical protein Pla108_03950 [Botrimarina colliarenosi]